MNTVLFNGRLAADPELKYTPSGTAFTSVSVAVSDDYKGNDGVWVKKTHFINVTMWAKLAEKVASGCKKGTEILVEGKLTVDTWVDQTTQKNRSKMQVIARTVRVLVSEKREGGPKPEPNDFANLGAKNPDPGAFEDFEDDIPF